MVLHSDVAEMNITSLGRAIFFVSFINETSDHVRTVHMKIES